MSQGLNRFTLLKSFCSMVIDSSPPPITASAPSFSTMCAAVATACRPEEQKRLTVCPATVVGNPAMTATLRPALKPCGPSGKPVPMTTSSISAGSRGGVFFLTYRTTPHALPDPLGCHGVRPGQVERTAERFGHSGTGAGDDDCLTSVAHDASLRWYG